MKPKENQRQRNSLKCFQKYEKKNLHRKKNKQTQTYIIVVGSNLDAGSRRIFSKENRILNFILKGIVT